MADLRGIEVLKNEIDKSRDRLKNFNENMKKLTGFDNPGPRFVDLSIIYVMLLCSLLDYFIL